MDASPTWIVVSCSTCSRQFQKRRCWAKRTRQHFCGTRCDGKERAKHLIKFSANGKGKRRPPRFGPENPAWKGGVTYFKTHGNYKGVKYIRAPEWAKPMARKDGYLMEHRLIVARRAQRLLKRAEVVNHIDRNPTNNDPGNLELWPTNADHKRGEAGRFVIGVANLWRGEVSAQP